MVLLLGTLIPSVDAVQVKPVASKEEALTVCKNNQVAYERVIPLYTKGGNDVFYSCEYSEEHPSKFNRNEPCDSKMTKQEGPVFSIYYECKNGELELLLCTGTEGKGCSYALPPPPEDTAVDDWWYD